MSDPAFPDLSEKTALIHFFYEDTDFEYTRSEEVKAWIKQVVKREKARLEDPLNYIFCSDQYLHQINLDYLDHDTLTDIITFPYAQPPIVSGDIFISVDRVRENAQTYRVSFEQELLRVMIHGVLHLCGYGDKTVEEKERMRIKENEVLEMLLKD